MRQALAEDKCGAGLSYFLVKKDPNPGRKEGDLYDDKDEDERLYAR